MLKKSRRNKRVLVLWYTIDDNLGDYFLFETVKTHLIEWGYEVIDMDVGLPYAKIAKKARSCEWLWFAGGGIIERGVPDVICNFINFHEKSRYIKYGVTGLSIGDFGYDNYKNEIAYFVENAQFFYTRDDYSAKELNRISESIKVVSSADVVFANRDFCNIGEIKEDVLGINFRTMPYPDLTGEICWKDWNEAIKKSHTGDVIGIPDQLDITEFFDFEFPPIYTPEIAVDIIRRMKYGLAMRFHVVLIAAMMGKVCIPICYCPKVMRLAEQLGIVDLCIDANSPEKLIGLIEKYKSNSDMYVSLIKRNTKILVDKAQSMFENVKKIMEVA